MILRAKYLRNFANSKTTREDVTVFKLAILKIKCQKNVILLHYSFVIRKMYFVRSMNEKSGCEVWDCANTV